MIIKTDEQVELMRQSALLVSKTMTEIAGILRPGITTLFIDKLIGEIIQDHKAIPSFLNYNGFPFNSCLSVNDVVVHGFPNKNELKQGDIISLIRFKIHGSTYIVKSRLAVTDINIINSSQYPV